MDQGKIVESGNHESLLAKTNGFYKNLYDSQFSEIKTING
jgi:subfamily B ATP-binding cassette protein MsbA